MMKEGERERQKKRRAKNIRVRWLKGKREERKVAITQWRGKARTTIVDRYIKQVDVYLRINEKKYSSVSVYQRCNCVSASPRFTPDHWPLMRTDERKERHRREKEREGDVRVYARVCVCERKRQRE